MSNITCIEDAGLMAGEVARAYENADSNMRRCVRKLLGLDVPPISSDTEAAPSTGGIDLNKACKDYGIRVCTYQSLWDNDAWRNNPCVKEIDSAMRESAGVSFAAGGLQPVIAFDADLGAFEKRYTVAHELGHILLGHLSFRSDTRKEMPEYMEAEANIFAAVLTANDVLCRYGREAAR